MRTAPSGTAAARARWGDAGVWSFYADEDDLDRRGRDARLAPRRAARVRARVPQLRQARPRGPGAQLPDERVHRGARDRPDRAPRGDRRLEERAARARTSTRCTRRGSAARRDDLRALQVHRLRADRALDRQGVRRAVPPHARAMPVDLPNTDWVAENHWCVPLYYRPDNDTSVDGRGDGGSRNGA